MNRWCNTDQTSIQQRSLLAEEQTGGRKKFKQVRKEHGSSTGLADDTREDTKSLLMSAID